MVRRKRNPNKLIQDYEVSYTIDSPDYYQGCGVAFSKFDEAVTGIGSSAQEALDDALENLAQGEDIEDSEFGRVMREEEKSMGSRKFHKVHVDDDEDQYVYACLRYTLE